jgi:mannose-6-phosphate isomerase-like protein (cupin superfamily)
MPTSGWDASGHQCRDRQEHDLQTGDFIIEMIGQWHQAANVGDGPVKLLVIDQVEKATEHRVAQVASINLSSRNWRGATGDRSCPLSQ